MTVISNLPLNKQCLTDVCQSVSGGGSEDLHLAFVVNHAAFFVSHRLPIALEARRRGWRVSLLTGEAGSDVMEEEAAAALAGHGITHYRFRFGASSINPVGELRALLAMAGALRTLKPQIVHCASPKGNLLGGLAARLARIPALVLAVSGMGYAFTSHRDGGLRRRLLAWAFLGVSRLAFGHGNKKVIVQNQDDRDWAVNTKRASADEVCLIPGSGVDLDTFFCPDVSAKKPVVVLPARLLRDKGVLEFVAAVEQIRDQAPDWRFVLAGAAGYRNPSSISSDEVREWVKRGTVEWLGHVSDMAPLFCSCSIVCLPSHREGMPKALLEAASSSCAVITTDATGTREAIVPGVTGDLVPAKDPAALAAALLGLIRDPARREAYGTSGRLLAEGRFGLGAVIAQIFDLYSSLIARLR